MICIQMSTQQQDSHVHQLDWNCPIMFRAEIKYVAEIFFRGTNINIPKGYLFKIINLMIGVFIQSFEFLT